MNKTEKESYGAIFALPDGTTTRFAHLAGGPIFPMHGGSFVIKEMTQIWRISCVQISRMYRKRMNR